MPAPADPVARGLTSAELAIAIQELRALEGASVLDAVALVGTDQHDDLLLVVQPAEPETHKVFLHVALGGVRARICTTKRRFGRDRHARASPPSARLRRRRRRYRRRVYEIVLAVIAPSNPHPSIRRFARACRARLQK